MKLSKDKTVALVSGLFGLFMLWQSLQIKATFPPTDGDCGPALYPAFCCACLVICAIGKFFFPTVKDSGKPFLRRNAGKSTVENQTAAAGGFFCVPGDIRIS